MNIITLDFETYFDDDYSLKKLMTEEYVRDERFEVLGCGLRLERDLITGEGPPYTIWEYGEGVRGIFDVIDWNQTAVLCHHAHFDGLILSYHYGIKPKFWLDTLSMARMVHGNHISISLASLSKLYNLEPKNVPYELFKGKHWNEIEPEAQKQIADGCLHDVQLTKTIFDFMAVGFPTEEYQLIDLTIRMFTEPVLRGDLEVLRKVWYEERDRKKSLLEKLKLNNEDLQSSNCFAESLRTEGIEPETKQSPKGNTIYAFAKTDDFMRGLLEHDNERVRLLAEARLGIKSSLNQTRAERIGGSASRGPLPIYLSYCAAHTTRWGGGDSINWQNLPRSGELRKSLLTLEGYKLAIVDLSQIECRLLNYLAGQDDVVEMFRKGEDPYVALASSIYGRSITKKDNPNERGTGKQGELSCGYGCGPEKFQSTAKLGFYGPSISLSLEFSKHCVDTYRKTHKNVVSYWKLASRMIARIAGGEPLEWGPLLIKDKRIWLPNGACIIYDTLQYEDNNWTYKTRKGVNKLYGAKLCQHICEALGRLILGQIMIRLYKKGYRAIMTTHDEAVFLVREDSEFSIIVKEFEKEPEWLPGFPIGAEGIIGERYEK
jgi:hypothetical protein